MPTLNLTLTELSEHFRENPNAFDAFLTEHIGADAATIKSALRLSDNISRDVWASVQKSSMSLSSQCQQYRALRDEARGI